MAVPLTRNAFAENRSDLFVVLTKRTENVLFSFFLHKTTNRHNFRKIFVVLRDILRLQKRGPEFLGNDYNHRRRHHHHHHHHHRRPCRRRRHHHHHLHHQQHHHHHCHHHHYHQRHHYHVCERQLLVKKIADYFFL